MPLSTVIVLVMTHVHAIENIKAVYAVIDQLSAMVGGLSRLDEQFRSGGASTLTKSDRALARTASTLLDVNASNEDLRAAGDVLRPFAAAYTKGPQSAQRLLQLYEVHIMSKLKKIEKAATGATAFCDAVEEQWRSAKATTKSEELGYTRRPASYAPGAVLLSTSSYCSRWIRWLTRTRSPSPSSIRAAACKTLPPREGQALWICELASGLRQARSRRQGKGRRLGPSD